MTDPTRKIAELRALLEKTTPGPWVAVHDHFPLGETGDWGTCDFVMDTHGRRVAEIHDSDHGADDMKVIAALYNAAPALLDVAEAADKVSLLAAEYSATWSILDDLKNANELLRKALARLAADQEKP